jgi:hypothetical protein
VKERPILFSAPMVRAILEGRKTVTRRIFKHRTVERSDGFVDVYSGPDIDSWIGTFRPGGMFTSPYGEPGDRLWVRETWCRRWDETRSDWDGFYYRADGVDVLDRDDHSKSPWRPSIHMSREASRITLRVTSIRVERLQAITEEGAKAEGAAWRIDVGGDLHGPFADIEGPIGYREHFRDLWDQINGARASWDSNPWVWVVGFERVEVERG